jgi:hypothetical protein
VVQAPVITLVYVFTPQARYWLTLSRPYSACRPKTFSDGVIKPDLSEFKKRKRSGRPS